MSAAMTRPKLDASSSTQLAHAGEDKGAARWNERYLLAPVTERKVLRFVFFLLLTLSFHVEVVCSVRLINFVITAVRAFGITVVVECQG